MELGEWDGAVACDAAQGFGEEDNDEKEAGAAEAEDEPEDCVVA